jgi:hypothetical protein
MRRFAQYALCFLMVVLVPTALARAQCAVAIAGQVS